MRIAIGHQKSSFGAFVIITIYHRRPFCPQTQGCLQIHQLLHTVYPYAKIVVGKLTGLQGGSWVDGTVTGNGISISLKENMVKKLTVYGILPNPYGAFEKAQLPTNINAQGIIKYRSRWQPFLLTRTQKLIHICNANNVFS